MQLYTVHDTNHVLEMIAPLKMIQQVFLLHKDAVARIVRETDAGKDCELYQRGHRHIVMKVEDVRYDRSEASLPRV